MIPSPNRRQPIRPSITVFYVSAIFVAGLAGGYAAGTKGSEFDMRAGLVGFAIVSIGVGALVTPVIWLSSKEPQKRVDEKSDAETEMSADELAKLMRRATLNFRIGVFMIPVSLGGLVWGIRDWCTPGVSSKDCWTLPMALVYLSVFGCICYSGAAGKKRVGHLIKEKQAIDAVPNEVIP